MNFRQAILSVAAVSLLAGCATAPQAPIQLAPNALSGASQKVGVVMSALPKVDTYFPGADCLLCYAAASMANSGLTSYTQTLPMEDIPQLKEQVAATLRKKGVTVQVIPDNVVIGDLPSFSGSGQNVANKDYSAYKSRYGIDKLVVINISSIGFTRNYSSYIPVGEPKASVFGAGYVVNLANNAYEWYTPLNITKASETKWDEPPKYPGLTNAYFQVLELPKDEILKPLAK